ncbi:transposase [Mesorhizobium camelthorni]|uniref:Transposase n=1 Tax=Allomesorhizobium camelthorni TaxID=475069 RepID=A0A6G4W9U6_9HYPH|nr:transposase [Mesorhizobium camelthorni]NGO51108.1 transposase [Mesorhizobium camelthorni]
MDHIRFVGLDIHKERISIAVAESGRVGSVEYLGEIANDPDAINKLCDRLGRSGKPLAFCYEAGPCGYGVYRQLASLGHRCDVVAPSLIPRKPGDRVKTNRRDATMLARLNRKTQTSASARYAALEAGQCRGALVSTMSLDARHLDRGSPKRNKVMRPDPRMRDC